MGPSSHSGRAGSHAGTSSPSSPSLSRLGIGTALGDPSDDQDLAYDRAIRRAIGLGVTHIDTAINYRCQRSERVIGRALREMGSDVPPLTITTKGGYLPLEAPLPATREEYRAYVKREYLDTEIVGTAELVAGGHCIAPRFLRDQIERSIANLGVGTISIYYIHNPEQQLDAVSREEFDNRMHAAFAALEGCVSDGLIGSYGCATWNGLRVAPEAQNHVSIESLVATARNVAGDEHHLSTVQMPVNLGMTEGIRMATQIVNGQPRTALEAADAMELDMIVVAPLMQGRLAHDLPGTAREAFPEAETDAACALTFVQMLPSVASVVVGMRDVRHVEENAALFA